MNRSTEQSGRSTHLISRGILLVVCVALLSGISRAQQNPASKSVPVQSLLAEGMAAHDDREEAARRWIDILYLFGPSDSDARGMFEVGANSLLCGRLDEAQSWWSRVANGKSEWSAKAREARALLAREARACKPGALPRAVSDAALEDERQFLCAEADAHAGLFEFAIRDHLKVTNLTPESPRAAESRYRAGLYQIRLGRPKLALRQWTRTVEDYAGSRFARLAQERISAWQRLLALAGSPAGSALHADCASFRAFGTEPDRGLSYAEDLLENSILDYALQEYAKVLCDIYTTQGAVNTHKPYARFQMGLCAFRLGDVESARSQWQRTATEYPDSPWASRAQTMLASAWTTDLLLDLPVTHAPQAPLPLRRRMALGDELLQGGLPMVASKEYLKVMHVLTPGKPNPFQAEALYKIGVCHALADQPDQAAATWHEVLQRSADTPWRTRAQQALTKMSAWRTGCERARPQPTSAAPTVE